MPTTTTTSPARGVDASAGARVRAYLAGQSPVARKALRHIRTAIRAAVPDAVESFSYGIPGFKLDGKVLAWYAGWKEHTSMYPLTAAVRAALGDALERHEASKGTIHFPLGPLPSATVVRRFVKARAAEIRRARGS